MTLFALKLIAMITMVIDHTGAFLCDNNPIMRVIGRIAFLTYAFMMAEWYYHLKDINGVPRTFTDAVSFF